MQGVQADTLFADEGRIASVLQAFAHSSNVISAEIIRARAFTGTPGAEAGTRARHEVFQFWDTPDVPADVLASVEKNRAHCAPSELRLFDLKAARAFIEGAFPDRVAQAFALCSHPAMQSDVFRLCHLYVYGGLYLDADDEMSAGFGDLLATDKASLWLSIAARKGAQNADGSWHWYTLQEVLEGRTEPHPVCYFYNDVMAAPPRHPVLRLALVRAVRAIEQAARAGERMQAHLMTGPSNVTAAACAHVIMSGVDGVAPAALRIFDRAPNVDGSRRYDYKSDARNWMIAGA